MKEKLNNLRKISGENCVTIILNTHRTAPDNRQDVIKLKNLVREAEERLLQTAGKAIAEQTGAKLRLLADSIDPNFNLESLLLFVNAAQNISEYVRLPLSVTDRVVVGNSFAVRDLIRARQATSNYYVLVLSQQVARLLEAKNDELLSEFAAPFPIENTDFHPASSAEASIASRQTNLTAEYFNRIDKEVNVIRKGNPLPVLIATEESNFYEYLKIADEKDTVFSVFLNGNRQDEKAAAIVREAWPLIETQLNQQNNERRENLKKAVSAGNFLSDVNEILCAVKEGRVATLYLQQGLFQPALLENGTATLLSPSDKLPAGAVDDLFSDLIELNDEHGGETFFLPEGELDEFEGFAAVTRY